MTTTQPLGSGSRATTSPGEAVGHVDSAGKTTGSASADKQREHRSWIPGPILPQRLRPTNRPKLWLEIAFIAVGYYLYTLTRLAAPAHEKGAQQRGWDILNLEHDLGLNFEHSVNRWVYGVRWLAFSMNVWYGTLHFIVPVVVLIWLYVKFPDRYRAVRTVMCAMTLTALIGFYFYSLCPPRLLPGSHFIDTFKLLNPWGQTSATSDGVAGLGSSTNEYAAMPSLHIGWSTWCALTIAQLAERTWVKILGILFPICTFAVIIGTANHYTLDAAGGLVTLALAFLIQRILQGRPVFAPAGPTEPAGQVELPKQPDASRSGDGRADGDSGGDQSVRPSIHTQA